MDNRWRRPPSLSKVICSFVALGAVFAAFGAWFIVNQRLAGFQQEALAQAVTIRAQGVQLDFARALYQEWRAARTIARDIANRDPASVRSSLDLIVDDHSKVSWAGIAALDGTVIASSSGLLQGQSVASRQWFQRGLEGDFAGDFHEAVLLANLLPSEVGEPRRFLDLASPIKDERGRVTGVLGLHIDFEWARNFLTETASTLDIDAFLVDRDGKIVIATDEALSGSTNLRSMRSATVGAATAELERWPNGRTYLTTVIPKVGYQDLPSFGWSLVARIDNEAIRETGKATSKTLIISLVVLGLFLAAMTYLFVQIFAVPFRRLAEAANSIMEGKQVYPYEAKTTWEAATLSAVVSRYQTRVMTDRRKNRAGY